MRNIPEYDEQLKQIYAIHGAAASKVLSSKKFKQLHDYVIEYTKTFKNITLATRVQRVLNQNLDQICCIECGKILEPANIKYKNAANFRDMFARFCSPHCGQIHEGTKCKLKETNIKKYGVEWTFQSENNLSKSKQTMLKKYGVQYAQQNKQIKQKSYDTISKIYGNKHILKCDEIKEKVKRSKRLTIYNKFKSNSYVAPLFSADEYMQFGDTKQYKWKCLKCGNEFTAFRNEVWFKEGAVKSYARCEKCYPYNAQSKSYDELKITEFLKQYVTLFNRTKQNRTVIPPLELDIYIPEKKLAIEYDGLYWHSDANGIQKSYHLNKTNLCEQQGIQLIHIFENEWKLKQDIVKSRLKNLLGIYDKTIYARKCEVKEIDSKTSKLFQDENHLQGSVNAKVNLGLFYKGELISLMTFGKCRFDKKHEWEILRFCNKLNYHIPGAAGKLLKYFEKKYSPKSLITYADRRWSQGKLYQMLSFKLDHISPPDYWYFKSLILESRQKYQKHKLKNILKTFDTNKSEIQNMHANGYHRIFDCGNLVFVKNY